MVGAIVLSLSGGLYMASTQIIAAKFGGTKIDNGHTYYVIRQDRHTETEFLENEDAFVFLKFNSDGIPRKLKVGQRYTFMVARPPLSQYRNIISCWKIPGQ